MDKGEAVYIAQDRERRSASLEHILMEVGRHAQSIAILESDKYQTQQSLINNRSELLSMLEKSEKRLEGMIREMVGSLRHDVLDPLLVEVRSINTELGGHRKLIWLGMGFIGTMGLMMELYRTFGG